MINGKITVRELADKFADEWNRKHYPHLTEYYFGGRFPEEELDKNLEAWKRWKSRVSFLHADGYDPHLHRNQSPMLPVYDEAGRYYGHNKMEDAFTEGLSLYTEDNFFNPRTLLMIESNATIAFPPYEWKENWFSVDVGYSEGWSIWDKSGVLSEFHGKKLDFFVSYFVGQDGTVEFDAVLRPLEWDEKLQDRKDPEADFFIYIYPYLHQYLMFNRFQLLFRTGRISEEEFVKAYIHFYLCYSLFFPEAPVYIGRKAFQLLASNVLIPANEQLAENGVAVIELDDFRDFGLIREKKKSNLFDLTDASFPVRIRIYDWEKTKILPLPSRAVVWDEQTLPLPEEVEAYCLDISLQHQETIEEVEAEMRQGKKLSQGRLNVYEDAKEAVRIYKTLPQWYKKLYEEKKRA